MTFDQNECADLKGEVNHKLREGLDEMVKYQMVLVEKIEARMKNGIMNTILRGTDGDRISLGLDLLNCIHNETEEVRGWLPWKHWKQYENYNLQKHLPEIKMEIVDLFHFVTELAMCFNMTTEEISKMYDAKHKENLARQERNY